MFSYIILTVLTLLSSFHHIKTKGQRGRVELKSNIITRIRIPELLASNPVLS